MAEDKTIIADSMGHTVLNPPKRRRACLVQYSGKNLGKRHILEAKEMVVGRSPTNAIVINEQSVSRQHARCFLSDQRVEIQDLGSSNGTYINNTKISDRQTLQDGDIIRLGTILLKYFAHDNIDNVFHDKIYRMATIDSGTQIFNKKYLLESLESEFKFSSVYGRPLSVIYFDLDFFKKVNDTYGHSAGDYILKEASSVVASIIRKDDIFGRYGGEEFVILLPNTGIRTAYELAERIRNKIQNHSFEYENHKIRQTISMGVSQSQKKMKIPKDLLDDADKKLYKSKSTGRNKVTI